MAKKKVEEDPLAELGGDDNPEGDRVVDSDPDSEAAVQAAAEEAARTEARRRADILAVPYEKRANHPDWVEIRSQGGQVSYEPKL